MRVTREDVVRLIQLQKDAWESLDNLLSSISSADWDTPTDCPGSVSYTHLTLPTSALV